MSVNRPTTSSAPVAVGRSGPVLKSTDALSATLEAGAQCGLGAVVDHQFFQLIIAIADKLLFRCAKVKIPGIHHGRRACLVNQGEPERSSASPTGAVAGWQRREPGATSGLARRNVSDGCR